MESRWVPCGFLLILTTVFNFLIINFHIYSQDREIMRVLVECCLQEKVFNEYYTVLASKLCEHDKHHKFTLQVFSLLFLFIFLFW